MFTEPLSGSTEGNKSNKHKPNPPKRVSIQLVSLTSRENAISGMAIANEAALEFPFNWFP